jgi:hypothetical protein
MAKIVYTIGELKGSIGGLTFQNNSSGHTVRQRPQTTKSSTRKQQVSHQSLQSLLWNWSQLTTTQRDNWNAFASVHTKTDKFGEVKTLTGANWFLSCNFMRILMGSALLLDPPGYDLPSDAPSFILTLTASQLLVEVTGSIDWSTMSLIIWGALPTKRQKSTINQIRKYISVQQSDPGGAMDITSEWETATGLVWNPTVQFPNANIFICLETIRKSSGITSPILCTKENTDVIEEEEESIIYYS